MGLPYVSEQASISFNSLPTSGYYWATSYYDSPPPFVLKNWVYSVGLFVDPSYPLPGNLPKLVYKNSNLSTFRQNRTYQYVTKLSNHNTPGASFSIETPWGGFIDYEVTNRFSGTTNFLPPSPGNGYAYLYSSPESDKSTNDFAIYKANVNFGSTSQRIDEIRINELDFFIQGFAWWRDTNSGTSSTSLSLSASTDGIGWSYYADTKSYVWFDDISATILPAFSFLDGSNNVIIAPTSSNRNYLFKFVEYANFNLSFTYTKLSASDSSGIEIYLSQEKPDNDFYLVASGVIIPSTATLIAAYTQSGSTFSSWFGLVGKQYLIFKATGTTGSTTMAISDIQISGGYWTGNNRRYLTTNSNLFLNPTPLSAIGLTGATFTTYTGTGNTFNATQSLDIQQLFSKIGNGKFKSGIWENGVWNSGWRFDESVYELYEIGRYFNFDRGKIWRVQIIGAPSVISNLQVGDKISIGNIVAIDFNEDRKLLKGYFTILAKNNNSIIVEIINNFPLRRIERDSKLHRIKVTKNVWLSGVFLNGYYTGIWNSGLFKGFPLITEMYDSNWIDGTFDGGHFYAGLYSTTFSNTYFVKGGKVGLSFSQPHRLNTGDDIFVDKTNKTINSSYDGTSSVINVIDEYQVVIDKDFISSFSQSETGTIYTNISSGLVQNFTFKSQNKSKQSSVDYLDSDAVFLYNSWIDVNYYTYSAVNIGRPQTLRNSISLKEYSPNNLYGYPTDDVLSSISTFRNSYNIQENSYSLGTKYKIFNDFIGESSKFETFFPATNVNPSKFLELGWTYSQAGSTSIIFSRTFEKKARDVSRPGYTTNWQNIREDLLVGSELQIDAKGSGGVLNLSEPIEETNFRNLQNIPKARYTMVEFDLARWNAESAWHESNDSFLFVIPKIITKYLEPNLSHPVLHFDNLNTVKRDIYYGTEIGTYSTTVNAIYLPVYQNINHLLTPVSKKVEYFYNKTNLSLNLRGSGFSGASTASVLIDNLKLYEVDMIPFFKYFTTNNINFGIEVPYQGVAPFIDYSNANFQFLDNVSIGLDSFAVNASNVVVSGVGVGIGLGGYSGGGGGGVLVGGGPIIIDEETSTVFD